MVPALHQLISLLMIQIIWHTLQGSWLDVQNMRIYHGTMINMILLGFLVTVQNVRKLFTHHLRIVLLVETVHIFIDCFT